MHSVELANKTVSLLASAMSHGAALAQGVAIRLLGDMVARRLERDGSRRTWDAFKRDPANYAAAEAILQRILQEDPEFRKQLEGAFISAMQENTENSEQHNSIQITGSGQAQIGNRGDSIQGSRIANRGGTYNEDNRVSNKTSKNSAVAPVVVLGLVAVVVLVIILVKAVPAVLHKVGSLSLSASSTCQDFMNASPEAQVSVVDSLAAQYHKPDYATPLGEPDVPYYCAANPSVTLGQFFEHAQP